MNAKREREKIQKVRKLAKELADTWGSIHYDITAQMRMASWYLHHTESGMKSRDPLSLGIVDVLHEVIDMTLPVAEDVIANAPNAGRKALRNIAIVEGLRRVWHERIGAEPPVSMSEAGRFADYMIEAFEAIGSSGNARASLDSWRKIRATQPKPS
jgi:hypothetical protein